MLRMRSGALWFALVLGCSSSRPTAAPYSASPSAHPTEAASPPVVDDMAELPADPREKVLAELCGVLLTEKHLLRRAIDDKLSLDAFPKYLEQLDGGKLLLLEAHVAALTRYSALMDDELRNGDFVLGHKGGALVERRHAVVAKLVADILSKPFDFTVVEETETDPKKLTFCKTEEELRLRWQGTLKLQALERIQQMEELLSGKPDKSGAPPDAAAEKALAAIPPTFEGREEKARKELATRYQVRFLRLATLEPLEPVEQFMNAITAGYDPHTQYLAPAAKEDFDIALSGTLEGIGAALGEKDHYIVVQELVPGGASWQQGKLEAGDLIIAVAQQGKDPIDVIDMPLSKVVSMIRGPKGTIVTLTVKKADGKLENISIKRDVVRIEATYARAAILDLGPKNDSVGYVYLPGFYGDTGGKGQGGPGERNATDDVRALLAIFQKKKLGGAIIDLRGNGGGFLSHARDISGLFIDKGPIVQTRDSEGKREVLSDKDPSIAFTGDVVVMVDRFSASAAEILAAALQDYERAVIVGTGTHGKGSVQAVVELDKLAQAPGGQSLGIFKLTMQQYFRVNGESTQVRGVIPDIVLTDPASFVESGERTLFHPIPWAQVEPLPHTRQPHTWAKPDLAAASATRVKSHVMFAKVEAFAKVLKARRDDTREPLERKAWVAKRKHEKEVADAADPKLKEQKPLFDVQIVSDHAAIAPPPNADKKVQSKLDAWKDELARDPWVEESLQVIADMSKKHP